VKELTFLNSAPVFIEISHGSLKALREDAGFEVPLEREAGGRLTASCKDKVTRDLQGFLNRKSWQSRVRTYCAIAANGVSLRRMILPASTEEAFSKLLSLQIEREFPLPPGELAWGYRQLESNGKQREILVAAVKKEAIEEFAAIFAGCGLNPVFTLAAWARNSLCPNPDGSHAILDLGGNRPEWAVFKKGNAVAARILPSAADTSIADSLSKISGANWNGRVIYLAGAGDEQVSQLQRQLGGVDCVPLKTEPGTGRSAAILGLKRLVEQNGGKLPLILQTQAKHPAAAFSLSAPDAKKWLVRAVALICALLILPYAEAVILKPFLAKKLSALKADRGRLATIDREMDFLQYLKQNQPPYLDTLYVFAKSAPHGMRIDSLNFNRRGDISLRGSLQNGQMVTDFRTKLIACGMFTNVVVEEQTPAPDHRKVNVRLSAQWKSPEARAGLAIGPTAEEIERAKTNKTTKIAGGFPGGMMPPPMMMPGGMPSPHGVTPQGTQQPTRPGPTPRGKPTLRKK
jgi:hypothetical protein